MLDILEKKKKCFIFYFWGTRECIQIGTVKKLLYRVASTAMICTIVLLPNSMESSEQYESDKKKELVQKINALQYMCFKKSRIYA